ncbi:MAG: hypothetical protein ACYCPS_00925 [Candidatus Saccharimonadales bacterium]
MSKESQIPRSYDQEEMARYGLDSKVAKDRKKWDDNCNPGETSSVKDWLEDAFAFGAPLGPQLGTTPREAFYDQQRPEATS